MYSNREQGSIVNRHLAGFKVINRDIDPSGILYWNNKWYTVGFCHFRNEIRSFRVERILLLKRIQMMFKRPEAFFARGFFL